MWSVLVIFNTSEVGLYRGPTIVNNRLCTILGSLRADTFTYDDNGKSTYSQFVIGLLRIPIKWSDDKA
jgi:hypothetical protein